MAGRWRAGRFFCCRAAGVFLAAVDLRFVVVDLLLFGAELAFWDLEFFGVVWVPDLLFDVLGALPVARFGAGLRAEERDVERFCSVVEDFLFLDVDVVDRRLDVE